MAYKLVRIKLQRKTKLITPSGPRNTKVMSQEILIKNNQLNSSIHSFKGIYGMLPMSQYFSRVCEYSGEDDKQDTYCQAPYILLREEIQYVIKMISVESIKCCDSDCKFS